MTTIRDICNTGVEVAKQQIAIVSHNIANVNTPGYERAELVVLPNVCNKKPAGVCADAVKTATYDFINHELYDSISNNGHDYVINEYMRQVEEVIGKPESSRNISNKFNTFLDKVQALSLQPNRHSLRAAVITEAQQLADQLSYTVKELGNMALKADNDIANSVIGINEALSSISLLNKHIKNLPDNSLEHQQIRSTLKQTIRELAEFIPVRVNINNDCTFSVETESGISLVSQNVEYKMKYQPAFSAEALAQDLPLDPLALTIFDANGQDLNIDIVLVEGGQLFEREMHINSGTVSGLKVLRDQYLPSFIEQLDTFAFALRNTINDIHNDGNGYPPPDILKGTREVKYGEQLGLTGQTRITLVDNNGEQIKEAPAILLDFDQLNIGSGNSDYINTQGIIQELNYFFGTRKVNFNTIEVGGVQDIKLVTSTDLLRDGYLDLQLEVENMSKFPANINILSATAVDNNGINAMIAFSSNPQYVLQNGLISRTDINNSVLRVASSSFPVTIALEVEIESSDGTAISKIEYIIPEIQVDTVNGWRNARFGPNQILSGDGKLRSNTMNNTSLMSAVLVDKNGVPTAVSADNVGVLQLQTISKDIHIAIDQMNSKQSFPLNNGTLEPTNLGFSSFFGLNDLFITEGSYANSLYPQGSALSLRVRKDIIKDSRRLANGKMYQKNQSNDPQAIPNYQYEVTAGDNTILNEIINLRNKPIYFGSTSTLPNIMATINHYANEINCDIAIKVQNTKERLSYSEDLMIALEERINDIVGVDINQEINKLLIYQELFAASAYSMKVADRLFEILSYSLFR